MALSAKEEKWKRTREMHSKSLRASRRRHSIFLVTKCCFVAAFLLSGLLVSTHPVSALASGAGSGSGYDCTFYVRAGIGYGVILSPTGNTSSSSGADLKFTFTYNDSAGDEASRLSIYSYCDNVYVIQLNGSSSLTVEYCQGMTSFYSIKFGGNEVCRVFIEQSAVAPSGDEYRQILASTQDAGWSSGYYVGQGATVVILTGSEEGGNQNQSATGWDLSPLGNVAVVIAVTITSLIPFFIILPDAARTLSDNIVPKRGRKLDGGDLYLSFLSVLIPLLSICVVILSTEVMLNMLGLPMT